MNTEKVMKRKQKKKQLHVEGEEEAEAFTYQHEKPPAITTHLFMWELVATFCPPSQVLELERLCKDVQAVLLRSNTGTGVLQQYWHAMWSRLTWEDENASPRSPRPSGEFTSSHPTTANGCLPSSSLENYSVFSPFSSSFTRQQGKLSWKKLYAEQYKAYSEHLKKFGMDLPKKPRPVEARLNPALSGEELRKKEMTLMESYVKSMEKKGFKQEKVGNKPQKGTAADLRSSSPVLTALINDAHKRTKNVQRPSNETQRLQRQENETEGKDSRPHTREDYKWNPRHADYQGKHKKGGRKKWEDWAEDQ